MLLMTSCSRPREEVDVADLVVYYVLIRCVDLSMIRGVDVPFTVSTVVSGVSYDSAGLAKTPASR